MEEISKLHRKFPESLVPPPQKKRVMAKLCNKASWRENRGAEEGGEVMY